MFGKSPLLNRPIIKGSRIWEQESLKVIDVHLWSIDSTYSASVEFLRLWSGIWFKLKHKFRVIHLTQLNSPYQTLTPVVEIILFLPFSSIASGFFLLITIFEGTYFHLNYHVGFRAHKQRVPMKLSYACEVNIVESTVFCVDWVYVNAGDGWEDDLRFMWKRFRCSITIMCTTN